MTSRNPAPRRKPKPYTSKALKALAKIESLAEADSREQIEALYAAAAAGKVTVHEALEEDIENHLYEIKRKANSSNYWEAVERAVEWWEDDYVIEQIVNSIVDEYGHLNLKKEIKKAVEENLLGHKAPSRHGRVLGGWSIFDIEDRRTSGLRVATVDNESELYIRIDDEDDLKIPTARVLATLESALSGEWTDLEGDGSAWSLIESNDDSYVAVNRDKLREFVHDIVSKHYSDLFDKNPKAGKEAFLQQLNDLDPALTARLLKHAKEVPDEEWGNFAQALWGSGDEAEDAMDNALEAVREYLNFLEAPPIEETDPQRLVGTIDFPLPDYARGRLDQAKEEDRPPWRVIRLSPGELSVEGTRLRHCVGKKENGYVRALAQGEIEIWSVRTPTGKPIFTMEVDASINDPRGQTPAYRSLAIKQVKGAVNRRPGFDGGSAGLNRPQEVDRLTTFFHAIGVDPWGVRDLTAGLDALDKLLDSSTVAPAEPRPNPSRGRARGFDRPYRRLP